MEEPINLRSISTVRSLLSQQSLAPRKQLGQNFLYDGNALRSIAEAAQPDGKKVLEIGPGLGALSQELAARAERLLCIEIDRGFLPVLQETLAPWGVETSEGKRVPLWESGEELPNNIWTNGDRVALLHGDMLKVPSKEWTAALGEGPYTVCANLPYYISTPILLSLLSIKPPLERIVVLVQTELAERLSAKPGGKDYGSLSIATQYYAKSEMLFSVSRNCFFPVPNVDSSVLCLTPYATLPLDEKEEKALFHLVRSAFAMRRKTLQNNLRAAYPSIPAQTLQQEIEAAGFVPAVRAENLSLEDFICLSERISQHISGSSNAK